MATAICSNCNAENPQGNRFCDTCGAKMPRVEEGAASASKPVAKLKASSTTARAGGEQAAEASLSLAPGGLSFDKDLLWLFLIIGFGAFLRLWELGLKPLHHDESIHAWYAYKLYKGEAYRYDPAYHGPFRYHFNALMFFIFGASDFTTRLLPAAFGIFITAFLWQWKSLLGRRGALFTAALVAISPTWVYVSRFIRDDIFMATGSLAICWGLFKYFETLQKKYIYWAVAGLTLAFTSHEGTWIIMGVFGSFLFIRWLWEKFGNPVEEENHLSGLLASLALLKNGSALAQLVAAIFAPVTLLLGAFGIIQLRESRKTWTVMLCIFFIPFTLLFSSLFTNMDGWFMGAFDSIAYWLGEQKTGRADRPWQFYIYMLSFYELAIAVFAIIGG
ncbi:MAG: flippase activity-associated protein Agl23, partial [candidate division FCPU426 bacterium]